MGKTSTKLAKKIQRLRKEMHISQEQFAEKLNISRTHVGHVEQGRRAPSIKLLEKMAGVLKVSVDELFK